MPRMPRVRLTLSMAAMAGLVTAGLFSAPNPATASAQASTDRVLYSFTGPDGAGPIYGLTAGPGGVLYGTAVFGGRYGDGCVFSLTRMGSGYTERILFSFDGADGAKPSGSIAIGAHGDLFGNTFVGGKGGTGTVFELVPKGPMYTEKVLFSFTGGLTGLDGAWPVWTPVLDARDDVFGIASFGGPGLHGLIYEMKASPTGYTERVLYDWPNGSGGSAAGLTLVGDRTLYGFAGSQAHPEFLYRLQLGKSGPVLTDAYNFPGLKDGNDAVGPVTVDTHTGVLYGTTQYGGTRDDGTVFSLTPSGSGYTEQVLHSFTATRAGVARDGFGPQAPLLRMANGALIGTTNLGGIRCDRIGCGTIFELTPAGSGYTFHEVYRFTGLPDGAEPEYSGLIAGPGGELFGTTRSGGTDRNCTDGGPGGAHGCGTVYTITP